MVGRSEHTAFQRSRGDRSNLTAVKRLPRSAWSLFGRPMKRGPQHVGRSGAATKRPPRSLLRWLAPYLIGWSLFSLVVLAVSRDLGLNLVADSLTLWFGVVALDQVRQRAVDESRRPARQAAWRELSRIHAELTHFINECTDSIWDLHDAKIVRSAAADQDSRVLAPLLEWVVFHDGRNPQNTQPTEGAKAARGALARCARCSDRLITRYIGEVDAVIIGAVEAVENGPFRWARDPEFPLHRMGADVWMPLLDLEHLLRKEIRSAIHEDHLERHDDPIELLPDVLGKLTPSRGWTQIAIDMAGGRIDETEEARVLRMRRRIGEID